MDISLLFADVAVVYAGEHSRKGSLGSGRLIAPNLILTSAHVVEHLDPPTTANADWKVCLLCERGADKVWTTFHKAKLLWQGLPDLDAAILGILSTTPVEPRLKPRFSYYSSNESLDNVEGAGFPNAWQRQPEFLREYRLPGKLRIATTDGPYTWTINSSDAPTKPEGWKGMSGASVFKIGPDQEFYLLGVVQEVPANFSGGLLQVTRADEIFCTEEAKNCLRASLGAELLLIRFETVEVDFKFRSLLKKADICQAESRYEEENVIYDEILELLSLPHYNSKQSLKTVLIRKREALIKSPLGDKNKLLRTSDALLPLLDDTEESMYLKYKMCFDHDDERRVSALYNIVKNYDGSDLERIHDWVHQALTSIIDFYEQCYIDRKAGARKAINYIDKKINYGLKTNRYETFKAFRRKLAVEKSLDINNINTCWSIVEAFENERVLRRPEIADMLEYAKERTGKNKS